MKEKTGFESLVEYYNWLDARYPNALIEEKQLLHNIIVKVSEKTPTQKKTKKESAFKRFWNSTVFPDMIARKKEAKKLRKKYAAEARNEAMQSDEYKKIIRQQEIDKLTGKAKQDKLKKLADAFSMGGQGGLNTTDKINGMLGGMGGNGMGDMTSKILGGQQQTPPQQYQQQPIRKRGKPVQQAPQPHVETPEEKIKRMLG